MNIIEKPWGQEEIIEVNKKYCLKKLTMYKGHRCSMQYHREKTETIFVLSGSLLIYLGSSLDSIEVKEYLPGNSVTIHPGQIHRMEGKELSVYLEASTSELDDVVRLQDDYQRATE